MQEATPDSSSQNEYSLEALQAVADFLRPKYGASINLEQNWRLWLETICKKYISGPDGNLIPFAKRHEEFWEHIWSIKLGQRVPPWVGIWPRGGAKSTSAEMAVVSLGARRVRNYGLYVCATQAQADDHIANIGEILESKEIGYYYPSLGSRLVSKYGHSKGWRRNRLRTASGFTVDAIGLDTAARGAKLSGDRPGFMVLDDLDEELDTPLTTEKKVQVITKKLLPAGGPDLVVIAIQNLVLYGGIFHRFVIDEKVLRADFLIDRVVSGPYKAIDNLGYEFKNNHFEIVTGEATWAGQDLKRCQSMIDEFGITAFLTECQHEIDDPKGGMFDHLEYAHCTLADLPPLVRTVVWVDPAVTSNDDSDSHGIQADALGEDDKYYRLRSWEERASPLEALRKAIMWAIELGAEHVGVETDQGGETWESTYREAFQTLIADGTISDDTEMPPFTWDKAGAGHGPKQHRASLMLASYERGEFVHVWGFHKVLERALGRFPRKKPYDLVDACYWAWNDLSEGRDAFYGTSDDGPGVDRIRSRILLFRKPQEIQREMVLSGRKW